MPRMNCDHTSRLVMETPCSWNYPTPSVIDAASCPSRLFPKVPRPTWRGPGAATGWQPVGSGSLPGLGPPAHHSA